VGYFLTKKKCKITQNAEKIWSACIQWHYEV
jgi:hypothetical protein